MTIQKLILFFFAIIFFYTSCHSSNSETTNEESSATQEVKPSSSNSTTEIPATQIQASNKIHPVDEGQLRPDFKRFREELIAAIDRKDVSFIQQVVDDHIQIGYGTENGKAAFIEKFDLKNNPASSDLWKELKKVLQLGGKFSRKDKNGFIASYVAASWPEGIGPFDYMVITGENVSVREGPGLEEKIIGSLSYEVVGRAKVIEEDFFNEVDGERWPWVRIEMADKTKGYVYGKYIHSPIDYRAYFKQKGVRWKLMSFVEGD